VRGGICRGLGTGGGGLGMEDGVERGGGGRWDVGRWIRRQVYGDGRVRWLFLGGCMGRAEGGFCCGWVREWKALFGRMCKR